MRQLESLRHSSRASWTRAQPQLSATCLRALGTSGAARHPPDVYDTQHVMWLTLPVLHARSIAVNGDGNWLVESADFARPGHLHINLLPAAQSLGGLASSSGRQASSLGKR